jgi:hypothetical protein
MTLGASARRRSAAARPLERRPRLGGAGEVGPRDGVDAGDPIALRGPVPGEELGAVGRAPRRLGEAVGRVERVQLGHHGERVGLVGDRGVDAGQQQPALAGVRGEEHGAVGDGQLGVGEPGRAPAGGAGDARRGREGRLLQVEGVERAAAGVPQRDDRVEPLAQEHHPGRDVQQRLLVHQRQVVVHRPRVLGPHRRARLQQQRHQRVVGDVLARVHQRHDRARARHRGQHAAHRRPVGRRELVHARGRRRGPLTRQEVAARAQPGGHAGSTRRASLSCWTIRESGATAATEEYQTACLHPVARRSITIGRAR